MLDAKKNLLTLHRLAQLEQNATRYRGGPSSHLKAAGARLIWLNKKRRQMAAAGIVRSYFDDEICSMMWLLACLHVASGQDPTVAIRKLEGAEAIDFGVYEEALASVRDRQVRRAA